MEGFPAIPFLLSSAFATSPAQAMGPVTPSEVVVIQEEDAPDPGATPASLTVIPLGDGGPAEDLASAIDRAAGTTIRHLGGLGDYSAVSLRGSSFRQVEVFLDGLPLNPDGAGVVDLSAFPVSSFSRVEVYRGFAPPSFGSAAMGGVLNLVTPSRPPESLGAAIGSWGTNRIWAVAAPSVGSVDTLFAAEQFHTNGNFPYFDDQGTEYNLLDDRTEVRANNAIDRISGIGRVRVGPVTILDHVATVSQELPGSISAPAAYARIDGSRNLLVASVDTATGSVRVQPRAWWLARHDIVDDRQAELGIGGAWTAQSLHTVGAQVDTTVAPFPWFLPALLLRGRVDTYAPRDLTTGDGDGSRRRLALTGALSGTATAFGERVSVTPVLQGEVLDNSALGSVPFEAFPVAPDGQALGVYFVPRAGVVVRPVPGWSLRANAGLYLRPPDFSELFGEYGSLVGNTDLLPETGTSVDVGTRYTRAFVNASSREVFRFDVEAAYARNHARNLIVAVQNSQQTRRSENVAEAYVRSIEAGAGATLADTLRFRGTLTSTLTRNLSEDTSYANNQLPGVPPLDVALDTTVRIADVLALTHSWSLASATFTDPSNTNRTAPRDLHGIDLAVMPAPALPALRVQVLNVFDTRGTTVDRNPYDDEVDEILRPLTDFAGFPLPGRTVMVAVSWRDQPKE